MTTQIGVFAPTRTALTALFADLRSYGIAAIAGVRTQPPEARAQIRRMILARFPGATGSYVFLTADDERAFETNGRLTGRLTLHHSGVDIADFLLDRLASAGWHAQPDAAHDHLIVEP